MRSAPQETTKHTFSTRHNSNKNYHHHYEKYRRPFGVCTAYPRQACSRGYFSARATTTTARTVVVYVLFSQRVLIIVGGPAGGTAMEKTLGLEKQSSVRLTRTNY